VTQARPAGTIHDLGYKRYAGPRRPAATRWLAVARNQIAHGWKTWWRMKSALGLAVVVTVIAGGVMFLLQDRAIKGVVLPSGIAASLTDVVLPRSIQWYSRIAFLVGLTIGARVVASDHASGAFTFYFARSLRPRDYILGKLVGMLAIMAVVFAAGPLVLSLARLGLADSTDQLIALLPGIPKALALGALGTLAFAAVPLGCSALVPNPRYAMALWASYYLIVGGMAWLVSHETRGGLGALDLAAALDRVAFSLFDLQLMWGRAQRLDPSLALGSLLAHATIAIAILSWQVRRAHLRGIGGGG
jgi:ABC-type transport system involved in multi-copper enzyme maturation permease subunit